MANPSFTPSRPGLAGWARAVAISDYLVTPVGRDWCGKSLRTVRPTVFPLKMMSMLMLVLERGMTYWNWTLDPVRDSAGRIVQLVETATELTSQVHARQKVEEAKVVLTGEA